MGPRRLVSLLAVALVGTGVTTACGPDPNHLALGEQPNYRHCVNAAKGHRDWPDLQTHATEFGIDDLVVRGDKPVTVTKAALVPRTTRLKLTDVTFVPLGNSVTNGLRFGDTRAADDKDAWAKRIELPATLTTLHPSAALQADYPDTANQWQVVVGVQPTGQYDAAEAIALTYTVDGETHILIGRHSFAVGRSEADCNKSTG